MMTSEQFTRRLVSALEVFASGVYPSWTIEASWDDTNQLNNDVALLRQVYSNNGWDSEAAMLAKIALIDKLLKERDNDR